jgi:pectinesterase
MAHYSLAAPLALAATALTALIGAAPLRLTVAADGKADHRTLQAAIDALPDTGGEIAIAPGTYREKLAVPRNGVRLVGKGKRPQDVVLVYGDASATVGGTLKSSSVTVSGDDFLARNLTIQNDYHLKNSQPSQAVALALMGDRAQLYKVRLLGAQDTLYAASRKGKPPSRQYFRDCYIEGHVDFIFGDSKAVFDRCTIHGIANATVMITAQSKSSPEQDSGYVFDRCTITADPKVGELWLGRAWRPYATVVFLRTRIDADLQPGGWREWTPGKTDTFKTAYYAEYASTGRGANPAAREPSAHALDAKTAERWAPRRFLSGPDGWTPGRF